MKPEPGQLRYYRDDMFLLLSAKKVYKDQYSCRAINYSLDSLIINYGVFNVYNTELLEQ